MGGLFDLLGLLLLGVLVAIAMRLLWLASRAHL